MQHVTCDGCGKPLGHEEHHVVKIEVFAARSDQELTDDDLDQDHLEAVAELLRDAEEADEAAPAPEPRSAQFRYDLCCPCRKRYLGNPLGRDSVAKFSFSPN